MASLISPLGTAFLLALLAAFALMIQRRGWAKAAGALAFGWLYLWSTPWASQALKQSLEAQFPPRDVAAVPAAQAIVVLGGAMSPATASRPLPDLSGTADRVWHAARLYHAGKAPLLILSGGSDPAKSQTSEAEAMRVFLHDLGVPESATVLEGQSRNTRENASESAKLLGQRHLHRILLVTSAQHMARALTHFRAQGLEVVPVATDYGSREPLDMTSFLPDSGALDDSTRALKEWVGQLIWVRKGQSTRGSASAHPPYMGVLTHSSGFGAPSSIDRAAGW